MRHIRNIDWYIMKVISGIISKISIFFLRIRLYFNCINWTNLSRDQVLSEDFIREFQDKVDWDYISINQILSENFIREFKDKVDWHWISKYQTLSEEFIREFQDKVYWYYISAYQILSEEFIREFQDKVNLYYISAYQILSEDFIREFKDKVDWDYIFIHQILSGDFIREFKDKVNWYYISEYQTLSEDFIREFKDKVDWYCISKYQILSEDFIKEFKLTIPDTCWLYKFKKFKLEYIKNNTDYEVVDDKYIIAYKSIRKDNRSVYKPQAYLYEIGKEYKSRCNYNIDNENSYGLSAWTRKGALAYHNVGKLLKVRIDIEDIGAIVHSCNKIRCKRMSILECVNDTYVLCGDLKLRKLNNEVDDDCEL